MVILKKEQKIIIKQALKFYEKLEDVIKNGKTTIYGNRGKNTRYPTGTQIVFRECDNQILVVCHAYNEPGGEFVIDIPGGYHINLAYHDFDYPEGTNVIMAIRILSAQGNTTIPLPPIYPVPLSS